MTKHELYVSLLSEECAELSQRAIKLNRFGKDEVQEGQNKTNAERLVEEFEDLYSVMMLLKHENIIGSFIPDGEKLQKRYARVRKYMELSQRLGRLSV